MSPIIGITTSQGRNPYDQAKIELPQAYAAAILRAGGVPILIPSLLTDDSWESLFAHLDGVLFAGGGDIAPDRYGGQSQASIDDLDTARDALELGLLNAAIAVGKPFLGICRGCQLVNIGYGGTLYTHIPDQLPGALMHDLPADQRLVVAHSVQVEEGTQLAGILGASHLGVNSHHHQGLKDIGAGLRAAGHAPDGLAEAIEAEHHPFGVAVQWHPEWLADQEPARRLFSRFVEAAAKY